MLTRTLLSVALSLMAFSSAPAQASDWNIDFSKRSISVNVGNRGHRVTTRRYAPRKVWVPGRYEMEQQRVWVEGQTRQIYVPPVYETRCDYRGRAYQVQISAGHYRVVRDPGCYEFRRVRVWKPGFWRVTHNSDC